MGKSEFIVPNSFLLINKSNWTNCKYVWKLYGDALVSEHQTNQSSLKIQENQNEIHEPNSTNLQFHTYKSLEDRFKQHLGYVVNNTQATGQHFNSPGHNSSHMTISVLEKVHQVSKLHREQRESHWIERFNLKYKGMNKKS